LTTVNIVRSVIAAVAQPAFAKLTDVYGRMELLNVAIVFFIVGTIVESQAYDVQKFAGGAILYQIGYTGIVLVKFLLCADFSLMNWRLLSIFVPSFPTIINSWINGNVTESMGGKWSWGIGMWAIIVPVSFIPLYVVYYYKYFKGKKDGSFTDLEQYQTDYQRLGLVGMLVDLFWKLDVIGVILFIAFMTLILVPLTLAGGVDSEWKTAKIIAPLVVGFCCIPPFLYWESVAEYAIFPSSCSRTVVCGPPCALAPSSTCVTTSRATTCTPSSWWPLTNRWLPQPVSPPSGDSSPLSSAPSLALWSSSSSE
jgi:SIT family siderophore-iron:H+ symporter-like MFS transporter